MKKIKVESVSHKMESKTVIEDVTIGVDLAVRSAFIGTAINAQARYSMLMAADNCLYSWRVLRTIGNYFAVCDSSNNTPLMESNGWWIMDIAVIIQGQNYRIVLNEQGTMYEKVY